jgi:hypothetical protein
MPLEEWIDVWASMLGDIEPTTLAKYRYFVEGHILLQFQGRQLGSLTFEEIERWEAGITKRISERGRPFARSVAVAARSLLITILGDAVHAKKISWNPAERRRGRRGRVRVSGRTASTAVQQSSNVITPFQALCVAERCALLSERNIDFVMNVFAAWTGVRWGGCSPSKAEIRPTRRCTWLRTGSRPTRWTGTSANWAAKSASPRRRTAPIAS